MSDNALGIVRFAAVCLIVFALCALTVGVEQAVTIAMAYLLGGLVLGTWKVAPEETSRDRDARTGELGGAD